MQLSQVSAVAAILAAFFAISTAAPAPLNLVQQQKLVSEKLFFHLV